MYPKLLAAFLSILLTFSATAQPASEIPLVNPEILKPPSRERGIIPDDLDEFTGNDQKPADALVVTDSSMTFKKLVEIVLTIDPDAQVKARSMQLKVQDIPITIITDSKANRMRAFTPFKTLDGVDGQTLYRMMQANFDSALDARYAIAKGYLVSTFIHPLAELEKNQFIEGLGQVANLVLTYGTAYTSGAMTFGGGDSRNLHRKLIDDLLKKGKEI
ncbi:MAG: hypothetical protein ACR2O3_07955 [Rhizobiaceae bacterium]